MIRDINRPWCVEASDVPTRLQYIALAAVVWCALGLAGWGAFSLVRLVAAL